MTLMNLRQDFYPGRMEGIRSTPAGETLVPFIFFLG